jgi:hypothetical protein
MTNRSSAQREVLKAQDIAQGAPRPSLDKGCDLWAAYEWRFNLAKGARLRGSTQVGLTSCQGSKIRRRVYTLTNRTRDFIICRNHHVEVGTMKRIQPARAT